PDMAPRHYRTEGQRRRRRPGQTGAGHYDDDGFESPTSDGNGGAVNAQLVDQQQRHVRHPPIPVPGSNSPFSEETEELFISCLNHVRAQERIPTDLGVSPIEWVDGLYGNIEVINFGRGGRQEELVLPFNIWWRRAV
ncbi:hypothetical protein L227DRAFT_474470, partial [Lentinus tigrinus ALCF2SS1-6]